MAHTTSKKKGSTEFPPTLYAGFYVDGCLMKYESLENLRERNDLREGDEVAVYELRRVGRLSFGITEIK